MSDFESLTSFTISVTKIAIARKLINESAGIKATEKILITEMLDKWEKKLDNVIFELEDKISSYNQKQ